jgi:hypothetical protein
MDNKLWMYGWLYLGPLARNQSNNCTGFQAFTDVTDKTVNFLDLKPCRVAR